MSQDTAYKPVETLYESRGLIARDVPDECPPNTFLNLMNCYERAENAMSSRYGTQLINRDPAGVGVANYLFSFPIVSLARMTYKANSYRYAADTDGELYRRAGNSQGPYSSIFSGLSGKPFGWVSQSCFGSSQPYLFIYDQATSIKDSGTGTPQLTGIDPSPFTLSTVPYSPLLTLIDNFNAANAYSTSGFASPWAFMALQGLEATSGQTVADFSEFFGVQPAGAGTFSIAGGTTFAAATAPNFATNTSTYSGFPSTPVTGTETVSFSVTLSGGGSHLPARSGTINVNLSYSIDGGVTFTPFYSQSGGQGTNFGAALSIAVPGITNLANLQIQAEVDVTAIAGTPNVTATLSTISAIISSPNVFGDITNGMLSVLGSSASIKVPIASIESTGLSGGLYQTLTITTQTAHGLSGTKLVSVYGSSNDLADGFYAATVTGATTLTVPFVSSFFLDSTGGILNGGAAAPATCVLTNEYSNPYPTQMSAWGFYQQVPTTITSFPIGSWQGTVAQNTTATVGVNTAINLNINNQATDDDLIVLTLAVGDPASIGNIRLQFDVNGSNYTSSYYYKDISPAYYQASVQQLEDAYSATEQQIFADTLGLLTGQTPNSTTAQLQPANISTGQGSWQTVYLRRGDFINVGQAGQSGSDWAAVSGWQIVFTTNTVGSSTVAVNGLYFQWGYGPSSFGGVGYDYRQTYFNALTQTESNGTPIQEFDPLFGYLSSKAAPFFLRQAAQITGQYSTDPQVSHLRIYRRGGQANQNWFLLDQVPNITAGGAFVYKDVIPDAALQQSPGLALDNDPPVTSSLQVPIATTLSQATTSPGNTIYSLFAPQLITVQDGTANFVVDQVVDVGTATNLEQVRIIGAGAGQFTAILRLQHNAGEPVNVFSIPRQPCDLAAIAYGQTWLAGDSNNPNFLYYSKPGYPENFGPQNYISVGGSGDIINAVVNWRGALYVGTQIAWYLINGGATPYWQPTGSNHGVMGKQAWTATESAIWYRSADGQRAFTGSDGQYITLPIEWVYRQVPTTPLPLTDPTKLSSDVMAFYNNTVYESYVSLNGGQRFRIIYDTSYKRFRIDDVPATAMLWEQDINVLLTAKQITSGPNTGLYGIFQDGVGDFDDGGWNSGSLVQIPIAMTIQHPFRDQSKPHFPKQYNVLETDANTQGQTLNTSLLFNTEPPLTIVLDTANTGTDRDKVQLKVNNGKGQEAYSMSILHTMTISVAPTLYQENIYAALLADVRSSFDTYWIKFGTDVSKLVKQAYFDYSSAQSITYNLYADGSDTPYFTFTLPASTTRSVVRVRFGQNDGTNSAKIMRLFRMVGTSTGDYQDWANPRVEWKMVAEGSSYAVAELNP